MDNLDTTRTATDLAQLHTTGDGDVGYDAADNSAKCYAVAIEALREKLASFRCEEIGACKLYLGDCRELLPLLPKAGAIVTDPPYHGVKSEDWDNQWASDAEFLLWCAEIRDLILSVLEPNASLYWFSSPQMASRLEVVIAERFAILNNIVWDKSGGRKGVGGTGIDVGALRAFWSANTERLIFAEPRGSDDIAMGTAGYLSACEAVKASVFGDYLRSEFKRAGVTNRQIASLFPSKTGGMTGCVSNWLLGYNVPTAEQYEAMRGLLGAGYLRRNYEDLRRNYEDLRRPFCLTSSDEWGDVWKFGLERNQEHPTQKPLPLIKHVIKVSTRPHDLVVDPFMGSGTTGVACVKLGRRFIGIELDPGYFEIALRRIEAATKQPDLFIEQPKKAEQLNLLESTE